MGIFDIFKKKEKDNRANYDFKEEDRQISLATRRLNASLKEKEYALKMKELEIKELELQQEIDSIKAESYDDEQEFSFESLLAPFLPSLMAKMGVLPTQQPQNNYSDIHTSDIPPSSEVVDISEEELKKLWDSTPLQYKTAAKFMKDDSIKAMIKNQLPKISDPSLEKALKIIRNK